LKCITEKYIPHYTRPIGGASTSDAKPDWWCYPRRKCRGEVGGNLHTLAHAQFGRWACTNQNVYTYNCPYVSADAIWLRCWYQLRGDVHTSAPAPIGSRRDAHLSAHAKYRSCRNIGVRRYDKNQMNERANSVQRTIGWAQTSCATPDRLQNPWQQVQGGVVGHSSELGQWEDDRTCTRLCCDSV